MAQLVELVTSNPQTFRNRLTTYDAERVATGFAINWFWLKRHGERGWRMLETLGKAGVRLESSAGRMIDSVIAGETIVGYFVSTISVFPRFPAAEPVLGWGMMRDGTPVANRGMAITRAARSPNSARLLLDFILSERGQIAFAEGGLVAYRPDVAGKAKHHLTDLARAVGERNLIIFSYDPDLADRSKIEAFLARWKRVFGGEHGSDFPARRPLTYLALYPRAIPGIIVGIGFLWTFLLIPGLGAIRNTVFGLTLAFIARYIPYGFGAVSPALLRIGEELDRAARVVGAGWTTTAARILLPLLRGALYSGYALLFITFLKEYASAVFLFARGSEVMGTTMIELWRQGDSGPVAALAVVQVGITALWLAVARRLVGGDLHV